MNLFHKFNALYYLKSRIALIGVVWMLALISLFQTEIVAQTNVTVTITADNAYSFGFGTINSITSSLHSIENCSAGDIFNCSGGPETYNITNASLNQYIYIAAWADNATYQGLIAQFTNGTSTVLTSSSANWEVYATGIDYDPDCNTSNDPTLGQINGQIAIANAGTGGVNSSGTWVTSTSGSGTGVLAFGPTNTGVGGSFPPGTVCGISTSAQWIWYNPNPAQITNPFEVGAHPKFPGSESRDFYIFRIGPLSDYFTDSCDVDTLSINTGFEHLNNTTYSIGALDNYWRVIGEPPAAAAAYNTTASPTNPRPANVRARNSAWDVPPANSQWIASHPNVEENYNGDYTFRFRFCLKDSLGSPTLSMSLYADDDAKVYLNGNPVGATPTGPSQCGTNGCNFQTAHSFTTSVSSYFHTGANYIDVVVHNRWGVDMGLNVVGSVIGTGASVEKMVCCSDSGAICGYKWLDLNSDGIHQSNEPSLGKWPIHLSNGSTVYTDNFGFYYFPNVAPGTYVVSEGNPGFSCTQTTSLALDTVTVYPDEILTNINFGNHCDSTGMICVTKFNDVNRNGVKDLAEQYIGHWLINIDGLISTSGHTDSTGSICFTLPAGNYTVSEFLNPGWIPTTATSQTVTVTQGGTVNVTFGNCVIESTLTHCSNFEDSTLQGWTKTGLTVTVDTGGPAGSSDHYLHCSDQSGTSQVFASSYYWGNWVPLIQGGCAVLYYDFVIFNDGNSGASPGYNPGFYIFSGNGLEAQFTADFQVTDPNGTNPGWHRVYAPLTLGATPPPGWTMISGDPSDWNTLLTDVWRITFGFDPTPSQTEQYGLDNICLLNGLCGTICGTKFMDNNCDSVRNPGELGLKNWQITLSGDQTATAYTDKNGAYCFTNLPMGQYTVSEVQKPGWTQSYPSSNGTYTFNLNPGENMTGIDFGNCIKQCTEVSIDTCRGGRVDSFATVDGSELSHPDSALITFTGGNWKGYDDLTTDRAFIETFNCWSESCRVVGARLTFRIQGGAAGSSNDAIHLREDGTTVVWAEFLSQLPGVGGTWNAGQTATVTLDLASLPVSTITAFASVRNVLAAMQDGDLDVYIQDDTGVDFMNLEVSVCCCGIEESIKYNLQQGWNLVSLPLQVPDNSVSTLFPISNGTAYYYDRGYHSSTTMNNCNGYWLKVDSAYSQVVTGTTLCGNDCNIKKGWNIVGSSNIPISATAVVTTPPGILSSNFFGYVNGYTVASTLAPGKGYWVKASQDGIITINSEFSKTGNILAEQQGEVHHLVNLTFADNLGHTQELFVVRGSGSLNKGSNFEMPPAPPLGAFDARFASQKFAEIATGGRIEEMPVLLAASNYPVTVHFDIPEKLSGTASIIINGNEIPVKSNTSIQITEQCSIVLRLNIESVVPKEFSLHQAYPNPFNPSTMITFDLPKDAIVTLKVYDVLGREVATLIDNQLFDAGSQEVQFNASNFASGLYFYRISAKADPSTGSNEAFTDLKKMVLLK